MHLSIFFLTDPLLLPQVLLKSFTQGLFQFEWLLEGDFATAPLAARCRVEAKELHPLVDKVLRAPG